MLQVNVRYTNSYKLGFLLFGYENMKVSTLGLGLRDIVKRHIKTDLWHHHNEIHLKTDAFTDSGFLHLM